MVFFKKVVSVSVVRYTNGLITLFPIRGMVASAFSNYSAAAACPKEQKGKKITARIIVIDIFFDISQGLKIKVNSFDAKIYWGYFAVRVKVSKYKNR